MTLYETIVACLAFVRAGGHAGDEGPSAEATFDAARRHLEHLRHENEEMRRTYGSHPLFAEKEARIARLEHALRGVIECEVQTHGAGAHLLQVTTQELSAAREALSDADPRRTPEEPRE